MGDAPELDHLLGSGDYGEVDPSRGHAAGGGGFRCADACGVRGPSPAARDRTRRTDGHSIVWAINGASSCGYQGERERPPVRRFRFRRIFVTFVCREVAARYLLRPPDGHKRNQNQFRSYEKVHCGPRADRCAYGLQLPHGQPHARRHELEAHENGRYSGVGAQRRGRLLYALFRRGRNDRARTHQLQPLLRCLRAEGRQARTREYGHDPTWSTRMPS